LKCNFFDVDGHNLPDLNEAIEEKQHNAIVKGVDHGIGGKRGMDYEQLDSSDEIIVYDPDNKGAKNDTNKFRKHYNKILVKR
jgi:hypothetical protein